MKTQISNLNELNTGNIFLTITTTRKILDAFLIKSLNPSINEKLHLFFYKQSIFDPRPENCLSFSKKLPPKIV